MRTKYRVVMVWESGATDSKRVTADSRLDAARRVLGELGVMYEGLVSLTVVYG